MALFRRLLGDVLRERRLEQGLTLRQVSAEARVSLGYISEIERGQKEASSELLASLCTALEAPLSEVLRDVSVAVAVEEAASAPTPIATRRPVVASRRLRPPGVMHVPAGEHSARDAVSDSTGLTQEEIGFLIAAAAVATGVVVALRAVDLVTRLWAPSGGRG